MLTRRTPIDQRALRKVFENKENYSIIEIKEKASTTYTYQQILS